MPQVLKASAVCVSPCAVRPLQIGDLAKVKLMLANGASANSEDARWKRAPIMLAADHGFTSVCQLLILHGAEVGGASDRLGAQRPNCAPPRNL